MPGLLAIVALAFFIAGCQDGRRGVNPGDVAPDIQGVTPTGEPLALHSIQGKVLVVNFWATWCAPCMAELPDLQALHATLRDKGLVVVGVAIDDSAENIKEAVARFGITYPVIIDSTYKTKRSYEIRGMPETYLLDSKYQVLVVPDPEDGSPVTKIIGPRDWAQNRALQVFKGLLQ